MGSGMVPRSSSAPVRPAIRAPSAARRVSPRSSPSLSARSSASAGVAGLGAAVRERLVAMARPPQLSSGPPRRGPLLGLALLCVALLPRQLVALPARVEGRQLLVRNVPVHLKGVCWNPVRKGGVHPKDLDFRGFVEADAELMAQAGINSIRTYEAIEDPEVLDVLWSKRIFVFNTVYVWGGLPIEKVIDRVKAVRDHPAILAWVIGNEWNYNGLYVGLPFPEAVKRVKDVADLIKSVDTTHPVATVHGEMPSMDTLRHLSNIDIWGINRYSGIDFGPLFLQWSTISKLPIFLGEYGADAYDSRRSEPNEADQAKATMELTGQIVKASSVHPPGVCIGGFIFEFADELWKDGSGDPYKHNIGGVSPGGGPYPDFTFNEEWWGIVRWDGTPRKAYWAYAAVEAPGRAPIEDSQLRGAGRAALESRLKPLRTQACGAHAACMGKIGFCCPSKQGIWDRCCSISVTARTTPPPATTTWRASSGHSDGRPDGRPGGRRCPGDYLETPGVFLVGKFQVSKVGCKGTAECQFLDLWSAEEFCDQQPTCTGVVLNPFEDNCAGQLGCYTARHGLHKTDLRGSRIAAWNAIGGRAWIRHDRAGCPAGGAPFAASPQVSQVGRYVFLGHFKAVEAQAACKGIGRLAMPKNSEQRRDLLAFLEAGKAAGKFSDAWPQNTIWLGGQYNPTAARWMWNDNTRADDITWGGGQPSAAATNQMAEPWLCMLLNGDVHDAEAPFDFGVVCEIDEEYVPPANVVAPTEEPLVHYKRFAFAGFHQPTAAARSCGAGRHLVMPKTHAEWDGLTQAIRDAMQDGRLSESFPKNAVWLGGHWSTPNKRWEWDDGAEATHLPWARDQPSASPTQQEHEPLLCAIFSKEADALQVHDCPQQRLVFGVMCESWDHHETQRRLSGDVLFQ